MSASTSSSTDGRPSGRPERPSQDSQALPPAMPLNDSWREDLSALTDGELNGAACRDLVSTWTNQQAAREAWHAYHLIGDTLRSDELAGRGHESAFLASLRERLAKEPVVIAPATLVAPLSMRARRQRVQWLNGAAIAAGFAVVAGVLWVANPLNSGDGNAPVIASTPPVTPAAVAVVSAPVRSPVPTLLGPMDRDPQLDAYLAAHRPSRLPPTSTVPVAMPAAPVPR
jgi:sigma-E factor negative regulatory protein RseA